MRPEILLIQISNMSGRWNYDSESDGNDSDVDESTKNYSRQNHDQIQGNNCFTAEVQASLGPTQSIIESKLSIISMPKMPTRNCLLQELIKIRLLCSSKISSSTHHLCIN